ncbi:uncharacterized protein N7482_002306 [Penicillium canariense]|uniref:Uncharacterized protein n=1 Tax=Penicillium canariense TaxID=189055 RepID=A0A9W9IHK8_9EURO|nr:uncharacterized protein N7482_002306 [Penicillium canariense]KAJ5176429.1 hypothetical protein N7482_002306 [Penicillium canariense]
MAAVRLRKVIRYPEDSDDGHEELDEQEQEQVIQQLQRQNDARNAQYNLVFTGIPLISATAFFPGILSALSWTEQLLSLLGILSLLGTAYTMRHSPLKPDRKGKKPVTAEDERLARLRGALLPANGAVCLLLTAAYLLSGSNSTYTTRPVLYLIPGAMFAAILLARDTMLSVDLSALKDLQYEYKGA